MIKKLKETKGIIVTIEFLVCFVVLVGIIFAGLEVAIHQARISDLQQIANLMASEIEQTGVVNDDTYTYLENLSDIFNMDVTMNVDGNVSNGYLALEEQFVITITYKQSLNFGLTKSSEEKTYVAKGVGIAEVYHK